METVWRSRLQPRELQVDFSHTFLATRPQSKAGLSSKLNYERVASTQALDSLKEPELDQKTISRAACNAPVLLNEAIENSLSPLRRSSVSLYPPATAYVSLLLYRLYGAGVRSADLPDRAHRVYPRLDEQTRCYSASST